MNNADHIGLAERLGLHAPFRTFPDHGKDDHLEKHNPSDSRKRGRRLSSSSALEPAGGHLGRNHSHGEARHKEGSANHYERRRPSSRLDHEAADSASDAASSSKKPPKSYERRPRHKTKGDKYTVKKPSTKAEKRKRKKGETSGARKQNKKRKRKERSGDALLHTFSAPNVTQDRLTVSACKRPRHRCYMLTDHARCERLLQWGYLVRVGHRHQYVAEVVSGHRLQSYNCHSTIFTDSFDGQSLI